MQGFRFLGSIFDSDDFNAVTYRLTSERMVQVDADFIFVKFQDRAGQGIPFFGGEFDDQAGFQFQLWIEFDARWRQPIRTGPQKEP